ncbi:elongation factor P maturation arginine rhamnosyltransferase EarP [Pseudomonas matsuisoli]|uniref:Protein-arginine rhamnosyltransferase n=1 Tax=Pseudomonas matsuisoli TaxID=1515666 RepID=A0A917Q2A1_9PSED|nr:elongation factor P maturation arginine rhamnosyltransferase EarP [Pseudomonas matsuisoli]GGK06797.1 hypothetical protein GCM10009304_36270 [Pseudomonas matsuisoli]
MARQWDIFCSVVDNYGDIGVTWRLARQLVAEHGQRVRLWVDDLSAFARICPQADSSATRQEVLGVLVCEWSATLMIDTPIDILVEAFACQLPASIESVLRQQPQAPCWINLEYLSGESWIEGCHRLPSPQAGGLSKYFFFPGFTERTGGLLREADLLQRRDTFQADREAQDQFLSRLGVTRQPGTRLISLFTYENAALAPWLDALCDAPQPMQLLVPESRILPDLVRWAGAPLEMGKPQRHRQIEIHIIPFVSQQDYDHLLWCCDLNIVRGEDSFIRAQWAGRPMLWHIYPQDEDAHIAKLEAFLDHYQSDLPPPAADALRSLWLAWNRAQLPPEPWNASMLDDPSWLSHARAWCEHLNAQHDLATQLVAFVDTHAQPRP